MNVPGSHPAPCFKKRMGSFFIIERLFICCSEHVSFCFYLKGRARAPACASVQSFTARMSTEAKGKPQWSLEAETPSESHVCGKDHRAGATPSGLPGCSLAGSRSRLVRTGTRSSHLGTALTVLPNDKYFFVLAYGGECELALFDYVTSTLRSLWCGMRLGILTSLLVACFCRNLEMGKAV